MKIRILLNTDKKEIYEKKLIEAGFIISEDSDVVITEDNYKNTFMFVKDEDNFHVKIDLNDVILFESNGSDISCHDMEKTYRVKERLYQLESTLDRDIFIRISNSAIINIRHIKKLIPTMGMKYIVVLKNNLKVEVTRNYYYKFKNFIGIWCLWNFFV